MKIVTDQAMNFLYVYVSKFCHDKHVENDFEFRRCVEWCRERLIHDNTRTCNTLSCGLNPF